MPSVTLYIANKYIPFLMKDGKGSLQKGSQELIKWALFDRYGAKLKEAEQDG